ncbi:AMP-binding protein, partial [Roseibium sp. RKSG952]|uniref:AMP-binding protein n=1 Tax=Roseibium sp. RKSG952 TaxID=2529384 RepID=UPI0012BC27E7
YLPLDPDYPQERLSLMLGDASAALVITSAALRDRLPPVTTLVLDDPQTSADIAALPADQPVQAPAGSLAYIIYTSGSTG